MSLLPAKQKTDVAEHPKVFDLVGLLFDGPIDEATCPSPSLPTTLAQIGAVFRSETATSIVEVYFTGARKAIGSG
jgi:hypothetical protein